MTGNRGGAFRLRERMDAAESRPVRIVRHHGVWHALATGGSQGVSQGSTFAGRPVFFASTSCGLPVSEDDRTKQGHPECRACATRVGRGSELCN
jgi:hypothetical protein